MFSIGHGRPTDFPQRPRSLSHRPTHVLSCVFFAGSIKRAEALAPLKALGIPASSSPDFRRIDSCVHETTQNQNRPFVCGVRRCGIAGSSAEVLLIRGAPYPKCSLSEVLFILRGEVREAVVAHRVRHFGSRVGGQELAGPLEAHSGSSSCSPFRHGP